MELIFLRWNSVSSGGIQGTGFKALKSDSGPRGGTESSEMELIAAIDDSFMLRPVEASCSQLKTVEAS